MLTTLPVNAIPVPYELGMYKIVCVWCECTYMCDNVLHMYKYCMSVCVCLCVCVRVLQMFYFTHVCACVYLQCHSNSLCRCVEDRRVCIGRPNNCAQYSCGKLLYYEQYVYVCGL